MPRRALRLNSSMGIRVTAIILFGLMMFCEVGVLPVRAQAPGTLSGVVLAVDGTPQAHARVYLQPGNGRSPRTVLSDAQGNFHFEKIRAGLYDVRAQANGHWSELVRNVNVKNNVDVNVKLQIQAAPPKTAKP